MPAARPQCTIGAGDRADAVGIADRHGRRLVGRGRIAQRALDEEVHDGDGDVGEQQRGDRLVDAAIVPQPAGEADPDRADQHRRDRHDRQADDRPASRRVTSGMAIAAAEKPPSTSAPSAADHGQADARGNGEGKPGQDQRRGALQRVLDGEGRAEAAGPDQAEEGRPATCRAASRKIEKSTADATSAPTGMTTASIMRIVRGLKPPRSIDGEATMAVMSGLRRRVARPSMLLMPKPLCCRVAPGNARRCDGRRQIARRPSERSGDRALDAFEQVVHAVEHRIVIVHRVLSMTTLPVLSLSGPT